MSSMPDISPHPTLPMIDIGANLTDGMYQGCYHGGTMAHPPDLDRVLHRAWSAGVQKIIVTGTSLEESRLALALARTHPRLYATVGVHPTRCGEFEAHPEGSEDYLAQLRSLAMEGKACGKVVAIGECGLDNDRLHFCDAETQEKWFAVHFSLAQETGLPMFLHLRNAIEPFIRIFEAHKHLCGRGVVHSFDGSQEDAHRLLQGSPELCIGLNGCSLKTAANVQVASVLPLDRLLLETDAPWCEIRPSHASHSLVASQWPARDKKRHDPDCTVKGRNEPCKLLQVLEAVAGARGEEASVVAQAAHANTVRLFFPDDAS